MSLKDEGNTEFRQGNWLKAAALYTKAIKSDPANAVLYSNRSAALLKLKKAGKALEDAEECIRQRPEWDKGHYRKALALELTEKYSEALDALKAALERSPGSAEMEQKARQLRRLAAAQQNKENQGGNKQAQAAPPAAEPGSKFKFEGEEPASAVEPEEPKQVAAEPSSASDHRLPAVLADFQRNCIAHALERGTAEPSVYILHGEAAAGGASEENMSQVKISQAFDSPDLLHKCTSFLRDYAQQKAALAACAVVPLKDVAYPQVWKRPGWPLGSKPEGMMVQLEAPRVCRVWFVPADAAGDTGKAAALTPDYKLLEPLFR